MYTVTAYLQAGITYSFNGRNINHAREIANRIIQEGLWVKDPEGEPAGTELFFPINLLTKVKVSLSSQTVNFDWMKMLDTYDDEDYGPPFDADKHIEEQFKEYGDVRPAKEEPVRMCAPSVYDEFSARNEKKFPEQFEGGTPK